MAGGQLQQARGALPAGLHGLGATGVEDAAGRWLQQGHGRARYAAELAAAIQGGHAADEQPGIGVPGAGEDLPHLADLDQPSAVHDTEAGGELGHEAHVVAHQEHGGAEALLQAVEGLHDLPLHHHVEGAGGLVGQDEARRQGDGHGDAGPLFHAAAQLVGVEAGHRGLQAHQVQELGDAVFHLAAPHRLPGGVGPHHQAHLVADAHHRVEGVHGRLGHQGDLGEADAAHLFLVQVEQVAAVQEYLAAGDASRGGNEPQQGQQQGRLAAAGLAHQAQALASVQSEVDAVDGAGHAPAGAEVHLQVADLEQGGMRRSHGTRHAAGRCLGLASSSRPMATRSRPTKSSTRKTMGMAHHHHMPRSRELKLMAQ